MSIFKSEKLSLARSKWAAIVLVVCFGMAVLLGSPIHDHDFDLTHVDLDCISCHLVHSNIGLEQDNQDLFVDNQKTQSVSIKITSALIVDTLSVFSRAPPVIC